MRQGPTHAVMQRTLEWKAGLKVPVPVPTKGDRRKNQDGTDRAEIDAPDWTESATAGGDDEWVKKICLAIEDDINAVS
jgi:hypothetical protein